jgi:hypothetical protein
MKRCFFLIFSRKDVPTKLGMPQLSKIVLSSRILFIYRNTVTKKFREWWCRARAFPFVHKVFPFALGDQHEQEHKHEHHEQGHTPFPLLCALSTSTTTRGFPLAHSDRRQHPSPRLRRSGEIHAVEIHTVTVTLSSNLLISFYPSPSSALRFQFQ